MKLLVVEDEIMMQNIIAKGLRKSGYAVDVALDGQEALDCFEVNEYDLIVLDLNLPKVDGMEVLRRIREEDQEVKILILSARSNVVDRIKGLDAGSNDYLVKPFDFHEFEARIRCLLRRSFVQKETMILHGNIQVDTARKEVSVLQETYVGDTPTYTNQSMALETTNWSKVDLTRKEYSLLEYLIMNRNRVISAEELIEHVWDSEVDLFSNSLKFHMSSLKRKLVSGGADTSIKNLRGQGYMIDSEDVERNLV
jgi:DNA-binding response OmpR family regulator